MMAEVAVEYLVRKLEERILFETNKRRASELNHIKVNFEKLRPFLKNADWREMMVADSAIAKWVTDVINMVYEVEDVIDDDYNKRKETNGSFLSSFVDFVSESFSYRTTSNKNIVSTKLLPFEILKKLEELEPRRKHLGLSGDITEVKHESLMKPSRSFVQNPSFSRMVARTKEFTILKEIVVHEVEAGRPDLVAITGAAGIGKTTLALRVYEHVQRHFDCSVWVSVCGHSATDILREMVRCFSRSHSGVEPVSNLDQKNDNDLAKMIHDYLVDKNFLLVLDNLDTQNVWEDIKFALPTQCRVKVVVTTRNSVFPAVICKCVLHLEPLTGDEDLELFHLKAHLQLHDHGSVLLSSAVKSIEQKILHMCQGNPLAIVLMGGVISTINVDEIRNWNEVLCLMEKTDECWPQFSLIKKIMIVCYFSLPAMLKCCFLYCGMFPRHCEVRCKRLIRLWVAESFTGSQLLGMTEEESARYLLDELLRRNLLEVAEVGINGEVESCRLLQPMQEFIFELSKMSSLFSMTESSQQVWQFSSSRFIAVNSEIINVTPTLFPKEIRSLHFYGGRPLQTIFLNAASSVKLLHVLDLRNAPIEALPDEVGNLVQLHYLDLRSTKIHELPSTIANLSELQTLDIRNTPIRVLPCGFDCLKMLRHLLLADSYGNRVVKFDAESMFLKDLQTLAGVKLTRNIAQGLNDLPKLRKLSVGEVEGGKSAVWLSESINQMKHLNSLTIKCAWRKEIQIKISNPLENLEKLRVGGWVKDLLGWISKLNSLKYLHLWDCMLSQDPISTLQHLPNLVVLSLYKAYKGKKIFCDNVAGFPKLKSLSIIHFEELSEWTKIEKGAMESLEVLTIGLCRKLKSPPKGIEHFKHLEMLQVSSMPTEFVEEVKEISRCSGPGFSVVHRAVSQPRGQGNLSKYKPC